MSLYAYCLSDEVTAQTLGAMRGVMGATPILMEHEGLLAVVSEYQGDAVSVTRENVLSHERVVQQVLAQTTPLPFRFGTLVSEARLRTYLSMQKDALESQLARVRGCVEMSVKLIRDKETSEHQSIGRDLQTRGERQGAEDQDETSRSAGTAYLQEKRREIMGDELLKVRAEEIAGWLAERLASAVRESVVSVRPKETMLMTAAYLVERARLEEYRERVREAQSVRREIHFLTSGPWPPYSFSSLSS